MRIGCTTALTCRSPPLVRSIVERHPSIRIHAEVAASARLLPLLDFRELDVVFSGATPTDPSGSAYVVEAILEAPVIFVASPSHPLAFERESPSRDWRNSNAAALNPPDRATQSSWAWKRRISAMYTASHYEFLLPLALSGDTLLLAPTFVVQPYLKAGELVILDVQWRHDAKFHFVTTRAASFSPIVREIREHARVIGDQLRDDWRGVGDANSPRGSGRPVSAGSVNRRTPPGRDPARRRPCGDGAVEQRFVRA